jgi:hypothetical protein
VAEAVSVEHPAHCSLGETMLDRGADDDLDKGLAVEGQ